MYDGDKGTYIDLQYTRDIRLIIEFDQELEYLDRFIIDEDLIYAGLIKLYGDNKYYLDKEYISQNNVISSKASGNKTHLTIYGEKVCWYQRAYFRGKINELKFYRKSRKPSLSLTDVGEVKGIVK